MASRLSSYRLALKTALTHRAGQNTLVIPYKVGDAAGNFAGGGAMLLVNGGGRFSPAGNGGLLLREDTDTFSLAFGASITLTWKSELYSIGDTDDVTLVTDIFVDHDLVFAGSGLGDLMAANNLSDVASAVTSRVNLGLVIGTNVQAQDAELAALAALVSAADKMPYFTGAGAAALADLTAFARTLLDDGNAATMRATLGVGTGSGDMVAANNLSELPNFVTARTNLGLAIGTNVQAFDGELAALAGLVSAADRLPYFTGSGTAALATFTAAGRALLDDTTAAAQLTTLGVTAFAQTVLDDVDAATIKTTLGLVIGTNVQAQDSELAALASLVSAADRLPYFTGAGTAALATFTAAGRALLDDADAPAQLTTLGVSTFIKTLLDDANLAAAQTTLGITAGGAGSFRNIAHRNGGLEVWQRSTVPAVAASTTAYTADGWSLKTNANQSSGVSRVAGLVTGSRYAAKVQRLSGQGGTGVMSFELPLDADEVTMMQGQVVTLSMTLKAGANWSPTSGNLTIELRTGTGAAAAKRSAGAYTGDAAPISVVQAITTTATRYSFTSTALGATVTQASIYITWTPVGTASTDDSFTIDDVQLEIAAAASAFERRQFSEELRACERHYEKTYDYDTVPATSTALGSICMAAYSGSGTADWIDARFRTQKRIIPTMAVYSTTGAVANVRQINTPVDIAATLVNIGMNGCNVRFASGGGFEIKCHLVADASI